MEARTTEERQAEDDTAALVRLAQAGDADAFERLVRQYYRLIYRTALRWLGHQSDDGTDDESQNKALAGYPSHPVTGRKNGTF